MGAIQEDAKKGIHSGVHQIRVAAAGEVAATEGGGEVKSGARLKDIGNGAEITALVKRLELRGLVRRGRALSAAEVEAEFNKIRNEGRGKVKV